MIPTIDAGERARTRSPEIVADAAHVIVTRDSRAVTGRFLIDEEVLRSAGVTDFAKYRRAGVAEGDLLPDLFL